MNEEVKETAILSTAGVIALLAICFLAYQGCAMSNRLETLTIQTCLGIGGSIVPSGNTYACIAPGAKSAKLPAEK